MNTKISHMSCQLCKILESKESNDFFIADFDVSSSFLNYNQSYKGRSILVLKDHYDSIENVSKELQHDFWRDLMKLYSVILKTYKPVRINVALLGNKCQHVHWHLIPRYHTEMNINEPPWPNNKLELRRNNILEIKGNLLSNLQLAYESTNSTSE